MARTLAILGPGMRLSDQVSIGLLARTYPRSEIDSALERSGLRPGRNRLLPVHIVVYYVLALGLFMEASIQEVLRCLLSSLGQLGQESPKAATKGAISQARTRVGAEPLRQLFLSCCRPVGVTSARGCFWRGLRVMAMDGTTLDTQDTQANEDAFGRSKSGRGETTFPQLRMALLAECGSHAVCGAALGSYRTSERTLAREMVGRLDKNMLLLADRGFVGHDIWTTFAQSGAQLLWRVGSNIRLEPIKTLKDGTALAQLHAPKELAKTGTLPITVRVVEYELDGVAKPETEGTKYRLITTLLDPRKAPAIELAALYQERWEIEILLDELKTHLRGRSALLRSKTPDLVKQEAYGLLLVHHAVRRIMLDAAQSIGEDPDCISFTATVRIIRRKLLQGSFSPLDDQGTVEEEL
jgi:hypothetical protein